MAQVGFGPYWSVDGPPPEPPVYSLLSSARVVDDVDSAQIERWQNGIKVYPYPAGIARAFDQCAPSSTKVDKSSSLTVVPQPEYGAYAIFFSETCSSASLFSAGMSNDQAQERFVARARAALAAVESAAVEREFLAGDIFPLNPHLADGNGTFPFGATATTVVNGFAVLENQIAKQGRRGMIHCSPGVATAAKAWQLIEDKSGKLVTVNGTTVVPGYGYSPDYVGSTHPAGKATPASVLQEWMYATGPVEVRRSDMIMLPDSLDMALNRGTNTVTYTVERYYVVDWDTVLQAAILVDRCTTNCGTPS